MGKLVANAKKIKTAKLKTRYSKLFMAALTYKSTPKKNTDVLLHNGGIFKENSY